MFLQNCTKIWNLNALKKNSYNLFEFLFHFHKEHILRNVVQNVQVLMLKIKILTTCYENKLKKFKIFLHLLIA